MPRRSVRVPIPPEPVELEPSGTVICEGVVPGRALPWKAPCVARDGRVIMGENGRNRNLNRKVRSYKAFVAWVAVVQLHMRVLCRRRRPYGGPVELWATFYLRPMSNDRQDPDLCNLAKAFEDAAQGIAIKNDHQVIRHRTDRVMSAQSPERVEFKFISI